MSNTVSFPGLFDGTITLNRVAFSVFGLDIMWYGVIIASGFCLAALYAIWRGKEFQANLDVILDVLIIGLPSAVVGARLYYVFHRWDYYSQNLKEILNIRNGGLAFYGGLLGAIVAGLIYCKIKKHPVLPTLDLAALGFPLAQGIGRWGNFVNCEAHGGPTGLPWGMSINGMAPVHPTFLYESLWDLAGFVILHFYSYHRKFDGELFLLYMGWYGFGRMIIEGLRTDSLYIGSTGIRVSQLVAFISFIVCIGLWVYLRVTKKYKPISTPAPEDM